MNRLVGERSPYLLQHATNPVDWYPWGAEALERARREDKPIFLSVGYSTCHWCHVMEHESFEDQAIADLLNASFVSIKVDREERPDVDRVYMSFVQATTGAGGWPMTVFITPDRKPFFGGTYFPPTSRWGRPGFSDLLAEIARVWSEDRPRVNEAAAELTERLIKVTSGSPAESEVAPPESLDGAVEQFLAAFDHQNGGFGGAPKFPRPSELLFLLREHSRRGIVDMPLRMVRETLRSMALGGMRDHVGGGFHRYSVDAEWRVPHFEKMLYDQAQLALAYLETAQATGDEFYAAVAEDTLQYVLRDMRHDDGGFYSAEDADSVPHERASDPSTRKTEGAFYVFSDAEIGSILGDDAAIGRARFGVLPGGNAPSDPHGEFTGKNLLHIAQPMAAVAAAAGASEDEVAQALPRIRQKLFDARSARPRPHLDDKVLTAWNGLMIAAFARAARVLPASPDAANYRSAAEASASFVEDRLWNPHSRTLLRRYRDGDAAIEGYAEDFAYLIWGLLELFQATGSPKWLEWAIELQKRQDELFWDAIDGAWFSTTGEDRTVLLRLKEDYDGAEPAASSVAALNVLTLARLTGDDRYRDMAERTLARYGTRVGAAARVVPMMLCALSTWHAPTMQVVVVGGQAQALRAEIASHFLPFAVHIPIDPDRAQEALRNLLPFVDGMKADDGDTAYVCRDFTCHQPVGSPEALRRELA
ncbi:MAG: thioredoxin domain-containing protein [Vicinamibacterales bacterium]